MDAMLLVRLLLVVVVVVLRRVVRNTRGKPGDKCAYVLPIFVIYCFKAWSTWVTQTYVTLLGLWVSLSFVKNRGCVAPVERAPVRDL